MMTLAKGMKEIISMFLLLSFLRLHILQSYCFIFHYIPIYVLWYFLECSILRFPLKRQQTTSITTQEKWESKRRNNLIVPHHKLWSRADKGYYHILSTRYIGKRNKYCPSFHSLIILYFIRLSLSLSLSLPLTWNWKMY